MTSPLCFLDCETDGVHPGRKPWEIAIIRREPDGAETERQFFVDVDLSTADPFGLRVGRFYDRHPFGRYLAATKAEPYGDTLSPIDAALAVAGMTHGAAVVGINPSFDTETLDRFLREQGLAPAWDYTPVCAKTRAVGWLVARGLLDPTPPPWKTLDITEKLRIPLPPDDERHTALGDARLARRMYDAVTPGAAMAS